MSRELEQSSKHSINLAEEGWLLKSLTEMHDISGHFGRFIPIPPRTLKESGLTETQVESLLLKFLWNRGTSTGNDISQQLRLPFPLVEEQSRRLKEERMIAYKRAVGLGDYELELTELGQNTAKRYSEQMTYFGAAPVPFQDYLKSVEAQSLAKLRPTKESLRKALADISINEHMQRKLGQALTSGRGLFLYGTPGNGKTSIAERVTAAFGESIWIPRAIHFDGDIVRIFDPIVHEELKGEEHRGKNRVDERWVCIRRPTIVVGGELTMDHLEITYNQAVGIAEAPVQMKSNCGTLVIDDFGRQRMTPTELLNRWIVPLEKRYDFLNLPSGKKIQVPFDELLVFSTNLEPREIVDEAFLRRIPYKIEVASPTEEEFRNVFRIMARKMEIKYNDVDVDYLIQTHYLAVNRPFRFCQPRDLLLQVRNNCLFQDLPMELKREYLDEAVENYFSVM